MTIEISLIKNNPPKTRGIQLQILEKETPMGNLIPLEDFLSLATDLVLEYRYYGGKTYYQQIRKIEPPPEGKYLSLYEGFTLYTSFDRLGYQPQIPSDFRIIHQEESNLLLLKSNYLLNTFQHSR